MLAAGMCPSAVDLLLLHHPFLMLLICTIFTNLISFRHSEIQKLPLHSSQSQCLKQLCTCKLCTYNYANSSPVPRSHVAKSLVWGETRPPLFFSCSDSNFPCCMGCQRTNTRICRAVQPLSRDCTTNTVCRYPYVTLSVSLSADLPTHPHFMGDTQILHDSHTHPRRIVSHSHLARHRSFPLIQSATPRGSHSYVAC